MPRTARKRGPDPLRRLAAVGTAAALLIPLASAASAQFGSGRTDPPCVLDKCLGSDPGRQNRDAGPAGSAPGPVADGPAAGGPVAPGAFDFYVLALSWSPSFCAGGGDAKSPEQCAAGANPGFVVHGLWPQNQHGYPENCDAGARFPSRLALQSARGVYPDEGLARHEWRAHGTCTGLSPTDYFAAVRRARQGVAIPPELLQPRADGTWAPLDLARSFTAANRGLRTDAMAVTCRRGALEEVRICLSKDLRGYVPCPEVARASCRRPMAVPAGG